jgi:hypothetical protein
VKSDYLCFQAVYCTFGLSVDERYSTSKILLSAIEFKKMEKLSPRAVKEPYIFEAENG